MGKLYIFFLSLTIAIFTSSITVGQEVIFEDNFDSYTVNRQIACQNPTDWTTWMNNPCSILEDPLISNVFSYSPSNSVVIRDSNDLVKDLGQLKNGICEINFQIYIPTGKSGYFNTLADFAPPDYVWAMQVYFDSPGTGRLDADGSSSATFNYSHDSWIPVKVVADLVGDRGEFWLNGTLIHSWQWSKGTFGSTISLALDGVDFFGNTVNNEMYVDNFSVTYVPKIQSTSIGGNWSSPGTWIGGIVPASNVPVDIVSTATLTLDADITRNAGTLINGKLICGTNIISGTSNFILSSNATLEIGSAAGISLTGATGNIQVTGLRLFNIAANYIYNGNLSQNTGNGIPATVKSLTVNNPTSVTLSSNISVSNTLTLTSGSLITNEDTLSLGTGVSVRGTLVRTSGKVIGNFRKWFNRNTINNVLFPIGTTTNYYPVNISFTTAPTTSGTLTAFFSPNDPGSAGLPLNDAGTVVNYQGTNGYWTLTANSLTGGVYTLDLTAENFTGVSDYTQLRIIKRNPGENWMLNGVFVPGTGSNSIPVVHRTGMSSFSEFGIANVDAPLPVELTSFSAATIGSDVKLSWKTATEINNYGFEIQKSGVGSQKTEWSAIGFVNGNGNSNSPKNYSFIDDNVTAGKYSYRLKQIDNDGQFEYSKTVEVNLGAPKKFELSQNYPNPFNPTTTISYNIPEATNVKLTIFNILGQEIKTLVNEFNEAGVHTVVFNASELNSGLYIYKLQAGTFTQTRKMTLIK